MTAEVRAPLRALPPVGQNASGPLGPGLLASGQLGRIIRCLQVGLAQSEAATPSEHPAHFCEGSPGVVPHDVVLGMRASQLVRDQPASKEALVAHRRAKLTVHGRQLLVGSGSARRMVGRHGSRGAGGLTTDSSQVDPSVPYRGPPWASWIAPAVRIGCQVGSVPIWSRRSCNDGTRRSRVRTGSPGR